MDPVPVYAVLDGKRYEPHELPKLVDRLMQHELEDLEVHYDDGSVVRPYRFVSKGVDIIETDDPDEVVLAF